MHGFRTRRRLAAAATVLGAAAFVYIAATPAHSRAAAPPAYSIDFHAISAGGNNLQGNCYRLSGTVGQVAPGYSSGSTFSLIAGYWQPAPPAAVDEIFFNGFEAC